MHLPARTFWSSGWLPASILAVASAVTLTVHGTPIRDVVIFAAYISFGVTLPGMVWVRALRGRSAHIAEDVAIGLAVGYCLEMATYVVARAVGAPLLFLLWPILTLAAFAAIPRLRAPWHGGERITAPAWWSWSLAAVLGFLLVYAATTYYSWHPLTGTGAPYVDMPYHLSLIGELRHHVPPMIPYVIGQPLAYHWFFYAEAAATSWATGIEPAVLLYRLSGLPMFVAFVVLTAVAARRLTGGWWSGPVAVAIALFGTVADPYGWAGTPVMDTQTLPIDWLSPTTLFGLALFAATIVVLIDHLGAEAPVPRRRWFLLGLLLAGIAGAKASLLPILIVGLVVTVAGTAIARRRVDKRSAGTLALAVVALGLATIVIYRGATAGLSIGLHSLSAFLVVARPSAGSLPGLSRLILPIVGWLVALGLWSLLWAGAFGLLARRRQAAADPRILLLIGICAAGLGAVTILAYPGNSQLYYLKGAAGAFGIIAATGIAAVLPREVPIRRLVAGAAAFAMLGAVTLSLVKRAGPPAAPTIPSAHLPGVLAGMLLPTVAFIAVVLIVYVVLRRVERRRPALHGLVPLLVIALAMGFSIPNALTLMIVPITRTHAGDAVIPGDGIDAARWLRDHSDPGDLVSTNLHCLPNSAPNTCDARHFWVSAYAERRMLVEGWAYTGRAVARATTLGANSRTVSFWDQLMLDRNDAAFSNPTPERLAALRTVDGVRWLFADLTMASADTLTSDATLRYRQGDFAVYQLR